MRTNDPVHLVPPGHVHLVAHHEGEREEGEQNCRVLHTGIAVMECPRVGVGAV